MKNTPLILLLTLLTAACSKTVPAPAPAPEQYDRYIFFSQQVDTKAELVETVGEKGMDKFGVVGFKYENSTDWDSYKTSAKPNVFYDDNGKVLVHTPEIVECEVDAENAQKGYGSYSPLQGWSNTKKYAFFAYYPIENSAVTLVGTDGSGYASGVPAIKYTMDANNSKGSMVDVMTATAQKDLYWNSSTDKNTDGEIKFTFSHRLSALGVKVKNSSSGEVVLRSLSLDVSGIQYQSIVIPLDGSTTTKSQFASAHAAVMALDNVEGTSLSKEGGEAELTDKLIFVPQSERLTVEVTIKYTRKAVGLLYEGYDAEITLPEQNTELTEGTKHLISLNFKDSTVEVTGVADTGWADQPDVENSFN